MRIADVNAICNFPVSGYWLSTTSFNDIGKCLPVDENLHSVLSPVFVLARDSIIVHTSPQNSCIVSYHMSYILVEIGSKDAEYHLVCMPQEDHR